MCSVCRWFGAACPVISDVEGWGRAQLVLPRRVLAPGHPATQVAMGKSLRAALPGHRPGGQVRSQQSQSQVRRWLLPLAAVQHNQKQELQHQHKFKQNLQHQHKFKQKQLGIVSRNLLAMIFARDTNFLVPKLLRIWHMTILATLRT